MTPSLSELPGPGEAHGVRITQREVSYESGKSVSSGGPEQGEVNESHWGMEQRKQGRLLEGSDS